MKLYKNIKIYINGKGLNKESGITLIALVITIIVLLILAGVAIAQLTENGLLKKSQEAKIQYEKSEVKEQLQLAVYSIQANNIDNFNMQTIIDNLDKEKDLDLGKLKWDNTQKKEQPEGVYKGYNFYIDYNYEVILGEKILDDNSQKDENSDILLEYSIENKNIEETKKLVKLIDKTGNEHDAEATNIKYNDNGKGIILDGSTSYGVLDSEKLNLTFPITITATVKWENGANNLLFIDKKSKIGIGTYNNQMILSIDDAKNYYYKLPEDFLQKEVNYITIVYNDSANKNELYINGEKMSQNSSFGSWNINERGTYLGRRESGSYFKGILYDFKIYNKLFSEQEISERYQKEKLDYENNITSNNEQKEYLLLEYLCNIGKNEEKNVPYILKNKQNYNYDIKLNDVEYDESTNGLVFNGKSSYGIIEDSNCEILFPATVTIVAKSNINNDNIIFTNKKSKIGIGLYQNEIILENETLNNAKYYNIKDKFLDNVNYITAVYGEDARDNKLYLNGEEITNFRKGNGWNVNESGTYLGRRAKGSYFDGILYKLKIYKKFLSEKEIIEEYEKDKNMYR